MRVVVGIKWKENWQQRGTWLLMLASGIIARDFHPEATKPGGLFHSWLDISETLNRSSGGQMKWLPREILLAVSLPLRYWFTSDVSVYAFVRAALWCSGVCLNHKLHVSFMTITWRYKACRTALMIILLHLVQFLIFPITSTAFSFGYSTEIFLSWPSCLPFFPL